MNVFIKNKNYRKFTIASLLSGVGNILFYLALVTYASKLQNYALAISLISITESIPNFLEVFSGYLADRTQSKFKLMVWLAVIRFAMYMIVGVLFATNFAGWNLVLTVIGINLISDIAGSYSGGIETPLIVDIVTEKDIAEAQGFESGVKGIINMVAQLVGSGLLLFMSYSNLAIFNALTFLVAGILYASVGHDYYKTHPHETAISVNDKSFFKTMASSLTQVKKANGLLTTVLVVALVNGILGALDPLSSILVAGNKSTMVVGTYTFTIALISIVMTAGAALGSILGPNLFKNTSVFKIIIAATFFSLATAVVMLTRRIWLILPVMFCLAMTIGTANPKLTQWLVGSVDHNILASTMGLLNTILIVVAPIMTTIFSTITATFSMDIALILLAVTSLVVLGITIVVTLKVSKKTPVETPAS